MKMNHQSIKLNHSRRIVIKVGSSLLVDDEQGVIQYEWLAALADDVAQLQARGQEVLIVSSGAIAVGRQYLQFLDGTLKLEEKQAAAATGMLRLAHAYQEELARHDLTVAQVLLTLDDSENRRRYLNARNTLEVLLRLGVVPLINENDTVATDEIRLGDNDRLGARVAAMVGADTLILLSDVDGLFTADPKINNSATIIPKVLEITPEIEAMAGQAQSNVGTGGMVTKLIAAKIAIDAGCGMVITNGHKLNPIKSVEEGGKCTWFIPKGNPRSSRKHWIAGILNPVGKLSIDDGALRALQSGKSLLPAGVVVIEGEFQKGDVVILVNNDADEIGRGLVAYSAADARLLMGHKSSEIENLLGYRGSDELIHRDNLVLL
tara:strand:+ start:1823 stop:2953 length:1131 start_codon:yes stop_codon:yes gene_type:complete